MAKQVGLFRRGARWYLRVHVPTDLQGVLGSGGKPRRLIWRSLRTGEHRVAVARIKLAQAEVAEMFERARRRRRDGTSDAELRGMVRGWFSKLDGRMAEADSATFGADRELAMDDLREDVGALLWGEDAAVMPAVQKQSDEILKAAGSTLDKSGERYHAVVANVRRAMVEAHRRSLARLSGEPVAPLDPQLSGAGAARMSMSDLVGEFMDEPRQHAVSSKTRHQRGSALAILRRALGAETATTAVSRRDARAVRDALLSRPMAKPATVNAKMALYSSLFRHAVREHGLPANVFEGLSVPDPVRPGDKRRSFTSAELELVAARPPEGSLRWVLLLGLLNGLRLSEATGLRPQDVRMESGVVVIDVVSHEGRGLKTDASARLVPAHPLIADALVEFMGGGPWVDLPENTRTKVAGQRLGRYLRRLVSKDLRLVGHSARHTFRDAMREGCVSRDAALQLGGWTGGTVADSYGSGMSPRSLLVELRKVGYAVDLSPLLVGEPLKPHVRRVRGRRP